LRGIEEKEEEEKEKMNERDWKTEHFSRGEILKGDNVKIKECRLSFFFIFFLILFQFIFHFSIFRTLG